MILISRGWIVVEATEVDGGIAGLRRGGDFEASRADVSVKEVVATAREVIIFNNIDGLTEGLGCAIRRIRGGPDGAVEGDFFRHVGVELFNAVFENTVAERDTGGLQKFVHLGA